MLVPPRTMNHSGKLASRLRTMQQNFDLDSKLSGFESVKRKIYATHGRGSFPARRKKGAAEAAPF